jgi:hypothetical protein
VDDTHAFATRRGRAIEPGVSASANATKGIDRGRGEANALHTRCAAGAVVLGSSAAAQVSVGIGLPSVSIGINLPSFPTLVVVPGYPVYYAPRLDANLFFYDGLYWVYQGDHWYASTWYNGPWALVAPRIVPAFVLRIPVRSYRHPPASGPGGGPMRRRVGASTGAMNGTSVEADGTSGTAALLCDPPRYLLTSGVFRESVSRCGATAGAAQPEVPLSAARSRGAGALPAAWTARQG